MFYNHAAGDTLAEVIAAFPGVRRPTVVIDPTRQRRAFGGGSSADGVRSASR